MTHPTLKIVLAFCFATVANAQSPDLKSWFAGAMDDEGAAAGKLGDVVIAPADIDKTRKEVFEAYKAAAVEKEWDKQFSSPNVIPAKPQGKLEITANRYKIDEGLVMPYVCLQKGEKPENGWPLIIATHGGGSTSDKLENPHAWPVNNREWNSQIKLSLMMYPNNAIYFVPRMVDDNQGRWWKEFNHTAYDAMIRHAILFWDVDPNRVYMLGISEGGYGTETLACRYPDKLAAANGLACGSGTSIHVENLRNLPFRTDVGEKDTAFGRVTNAIKKHEVIESLRENDPDGYINHLEVHEGRGHGINYKPGPEWMVEHVRTPIPNRVTYTLFQHDGVKNKGAYWLQATNDLEKKVIFLDAQIDSDKNSISISAEATKEDEKVQSADAQQPLAEAGETAPATGLELRLWLHESRLDLTRPVTININGKEVKTFTPELQLKNMNESLMDFYDPNYIYPAKVDVVVP